MLVIHGWGGPGLVDDGADGGIDVLDARTGARLATVAAGAITPATLWLVPHPQLVAVDEQQGRTFLLDRAPGLHRGTLLPAQVTIVDDRRARMLDSLPVAAFPVAVAVDAAAARLFVVNNYADCHWPSLTRDNTATARPASCSDHGSVSVFDIGGL